MQPQRQASGLRFLENLAYLVPGYQGYKRHSTRREEDALLRARVVREIRQVMRLLDALRQHWNAHLGELVSEQFQHRGARLEAVAETLRSAPYRAQTFFDADIVNAGTLEKILEADLLVLADLQDAAAAIEAGWSRHAPPKNMAAFFAPLDEGCTRLEGHLIMREKLLASR